MGSWSSALLTGMVEGAVSVATMTVTVLAPAVYCTVTHPTVPVAPKPDSMKDLLEP